MALSRRQRLLVEISKELECSICLERLTNPRSLSCHHVYCLSCLQDLSAAADYVDVLVCPECRHRTILHREQTVASLHCPVPLRKLEAVCDSLEEFVRDVPSAESGVCEFCHREREQRPGVVYCYQCSAMLCEECADHHRTVATFRGHSVTDTFTHCTTHTNKVCTMYCGGCLDFVCHLCAVRAQHRGHALVSLTEGATKARAELDKQARTVAVYMAALHDLMMVTQDVIHKLQTHADQIQRDIHRQVRTAGNQAVRQANNLTQQLRQLVQGQEEQIGIVQRQMEGYIQRLEELVTRCEELMAPTQDSVTVITGGVAVTRACTALYQEVLGVSVVVDIPGFVPEDGRRLGQLGVSVTRTYTPSVRDSQVGTTVSSATQGDGPTPHLAPRLLPIRQGVIPLTLIVLGLAVVMKGLNMCALWGLWTLGEVDLSLWVWLSVSVVCVTSLYVLSKLHLNLTGM